MEDEEGGHAVGVDAAEGGGLTFGDGDYAQYEYEEEGEYGGCADEAFFFAYGAEYEVGVLFGHIFELCLGAVEEAFAGKAARANGYCRLVDIVSCATNGFHNAQSHFDAEPLVRLKFLEGHVYREHETYRKH